MLESDGTLEPKYILEAAGTNCDESSMVLEPFGVLNPDGKTDLGDMLKLKVALYLKTALRLDHALELRYIPV
ncbi:hypothetical protein CANCADRAFT_58771 [Tortispora caseinolytica NRRL Y-17796]|uniref:Uncharacterized protein n=1 Tax=Tortispora caseinolytica NRRL Y-17796 TaxID=767744 RepID=A0A1E4T9Q1_9ASCO|nr:hypothetical protein CANCADRAFT_58771 [Tortispora caseinolytica NRRL Y-17796]